MSGEEELKAPYHIFNFVVVSKGTNTAKEIVNAHTK